MRRRRHKLQVSTFPFLAVLLCAMGALILVLLVMDRRSKQAARARGQQEYTRRIEQRAQERKIQRERQEQAQRAAWEQKRQTLKAKVDQEEQRLDSELSAVRLRLQQALARLHEERQGVANLETELAAEQERLSQQEQAVARARGQAEKSAKVLQDADRTRAELTANLVALERTLEEVKEARTREAQSYSVVPYKGKQGESRRPIYVECADKGLVFHPDRQEIPLQAAEEEMRAEVLRRIARHKDTLPPGADPRPYLLLLVRPSGSGGYYKLQNALKDLSIDFGYEFIEDDWVLDFPADTTPPSRPEPWSVADRTASQPPRGVPFGSTGRSPGGLSDSNGTLGSGPSAPSGAKEVVVNKSHSTRSIPGSLALGFPKGPPGTERPEGAGKPSPPGLPGFGPGGTSPGLELPSGGLPRGGDPGGVPTGSSPPAPLARPTPRPNSAPGIALAPPVPGGTPPSELGPPRNSAEAVGVSRNAEPPRLVDAPLPPPVSGGSFAPPGSSTERGEPALLPELPRASASAGASANTTAAPEGKGRTTAGAARAKPGSGSEDPLARFAPPSPLGASTPVSRPRPLRPANLHGDREFIIYVECRRDEVVLYPARQRYPVDSLNHSLGHNPFYQAVRNMIARKEAFVKAEDKPLRVHVRFLVHPDGLETLHCAYPALATLPLTKTRQTLQPEDDVAAIVAGN